MHRKSAFSLGISNSNLACVIIDLQRTRKVKKKKKSKFRLSSTLRKHKEAITQQTCLVVLFPVLEELRRGGRCMLRPGGEAVDEVKTRVLLPNLPPENKTRGIKRDIC